MSELLTTLRQWANDIAPGGYWYVAGYAGLWYLSLGLDRSDSDDSIGFRLEELAELVRDAEEAPQLRAALARAEASTARLTYLENLIQDLPHEDQCPCSGYIVKPPKCRCWKSDAQKVEQEDPTP